MSSKAGKKTVESASVGPVGQFADPSPALWVSATGRQTGMIRMRGGLEARYTSNAPRELVFRRTPKQLIATILAGTRNNSVVLLHFICVVALRSTTTPQPCNRLRAILFSFQWPCVPNIPVLPYGDPLPLIGLARRKSCRSFAAALSAAQTAGEALSGTSRAIPPQHRRKALRSPHRPAEHQNSASFPPARQTTACAARPPY